MNSNSANNLNENSSNKNNIKFADYGTTFAKEWYQIFFYDQEGNIVEVHQFIDKN